ncbi:MAG: hypothetical protein JWM68_1230 [Verrucomicrobiales bacterium]|nr:hypothetical protein [Verrucomicrobiales bacterium]
MLGNVRAFSCLNAVDGANCYKSVLIMAWRIDESVVRGEIDNREKGIIRGRVWLIHRAEPMLLELAGNAQSDLAGCLLKFKNSVPPVKHPNLDALHADQRGTAGDLTASRKVRAFDLPFEEAYDMIKRGDKPPEHTANAVYLEWFSERNGRVVIESSEFKIEISEPAWRLTEQEEEERSKGVENGWKTFTKQLDEAVKSQRYEPPKELEDWDEFDFEKSMRESDAVTDKYLELLDKYGDTPESEELINKEMGWDKDEDQMEEEEAEPIGKQFSTEETNLVCDESKDFQPDPATEGVDWIRVKDELGEDIRHPLQHRCHVSAMSFWKKCDELGLVESDDEDLGQLLAEFQITGAKLAGALNSIGYSRETQEPAFVVACLKRALDHLHKAQAALERVAPKKLFPEKLRSKVRADLFEIREEILRLMNEFRKAKQ